MQLLGHGLAVPSLFPEGIGNHYRFRFTFQAANHMLHALIRRNRCQVFCDMGSVESTEAGRKFLNDRFLIFQNQVAVDDVFEFAQIARPLMAAQRVQKSRRQGQGIDVVASSSLYG